MRVSHPPERIYLSIFLLYVSRYRKWAWSSKFERNYNDKKLDRLGKSQVTSVIKGKAHKMGQTRKMRKWKRWKKFSLPSFDFFVNYELLLSRFYSILTRRHGCVTLNEAKSQVSAWHGKPRMKIRKSSFS